MTTLNNSRPSDGQDGGALRPCPFCGSPGKTHFQGIQMDNRWAVGCSSPGCFVLTCDFLCEPDAIAAWNRRSELESRDADIARLTRALVIWCEAMETGRSEPLFIARDHSNRLMADRALSIIPQGEKGAYATTSAAGSPSDDTATAPACQSERGR